MRRLTYKGLISSDWNQCLAPCGPFDVVAFNYPELSSEIEVVFRQYTGNTISLGEANSRIQTLLPHPISIQQMDRYLENSFQTYTGVPELIEWCLHNDFLFMINTTGFMGYFQRLFIKGFLPKVSVLSANPLIRYPFSNDDPPLYELLETGDKGKNTEKVLKYFNIPTDNAVLIGDSGGDGPHFEWGERHGVFKIGCMAKPSLIQFCAKKKISINMFFGSSILNEQRDLHKELDVDFFELHSVFKRLSI